MNMTPNDELSSPEEEWPVKPYYKRELVQAYAPDISPIAALNRLAQWIKLNLLLREALGQTGYKARRQIFTSLQVKLIFKYLGRP
ncbi:MAG: DUF4248 domain-containing protein [Bacteroides sp.]|nr:DUF4248 domain-containing protein [Bacteroides sp.]